MNISRNGRHTFLGATALLLGLLSLIGCNRRDYRLRADRDVDVLIAEKSNDPRWALPGFTIRQNPRSRFFDVYDFDAPPMPQDDPASHQYMQRVAGKKGWPFWASWGFREDWGDREGLDNPNWQVQLAEYVDVNAEGAIKLNVDSALALALVNSPDYQRQLETLYLSALDVSTERFRLETQFFGGVATTYDHFGRENRNALTQLNPGTGAFVIRDQNRLNQAADFQIQRRFATAGELLVGFANSFTWQFTGDNSDFAFSLLNFNLVQPLLRRAGRDIGLEQLTIVERGMLANLRAFQRYRQGFYTSVTIGQSAGGAQRQGGFFGGTGLTGFTGQGTGGFGGVGAATGFGGFRGGTGAAGGGGAGGGFAGGGAGAVGGFLGLLQALQEVRNAEANLNLQVRTLKLLEAYLDAGVIDLTQVDQFRQNVETERATLMQSQNALQNQLDTYKTSTLGLPPDLSIELDDSLIRQFQFIDPRMFAAEMRVGEIQDRLGDLGPEPAIESLQELLALVDQLRKDIVPLMDGVKSQDFGKLQAARPIRQRVLNESELKSFEDEMQILDGTYAELLKRFQETEVELQKIVDGLSDETKRQSVTALVNWLTELLRVVQETSLVQARARVESITIEPFDLDWQTAFRIAQANRFDLMNNRASLVDTWRLVEFNADALQSDLSVRMSGDVQTVGNNSAKLQAPTGSMRANLQFDPPFTRLLERNNFVQALIDYQQERRQLIQFEDSIHQSLRQILRRMNELQINLEIQRRAVVIAGRRVDNQRENLYNPDPTTGFSPTTALNLLTALSDLRNTQNNFMSVWLNYYATRMLLYRELGVMQIDAQGRWIDMPLDITVPSEIEPLPPALPAEGVELVTEVKNYSARRLKVKEAVAEGPAARTSVRAVRNYE